ncbi:hypothetical protein SAMD00023353_5600250 [Rosellinia necatrix]|uniref:Uncharacterized protein n=1 Tax=Rosellinia necatrix TaxID=77044 RepID=A0A1S8AA22_ROSNE|nr:hypothetical protein SAMD00023353_5600250 [Rosellinia necatrix]
MDAKIRDGRGMAEQARTRFPYVGERASHAQRQGSRTAHAGRPDVVDIHG